MGRLIDADKLMEDVRKNSESYFADDFAEQWVNRQQTVDAIPVNWIEAQIPGSTEFYAVVTTIILRHLIDEYRKEQNNGIDKP